jgi:hypothetical protein
MQKLLPLLLTTHLLCLMAPAQAEPELWSAADVRIPIEAPQTSGLPQRFNLFALAEIAPRFEGGLGLFRLSAGPQWDFSPQFSFGIFADLITQSATANQKALQEYRLNLEPSFRGRWWPELGWFNRNRLEYRQFPTQANWRWRSLLRLNWSGWRATQQPYLAQEIFLEAPQGLTQSRSMLGIRWVLDRASQLDTAYMWRWRRSPQGLWDQDHLLMIVLFFAPPEALWQTHGGE